MAAPLMPQPGSQGPIRAATIGRYQIRDRLGEGGMGVLYLALDPAIDRLLALKVLRADSAELRERFIREAQFAARLQHPHIVTIYDVGTHDGHPFIAMEYIPGETLGELVRRRAPLAVSRRLLLMADVCQGLHYAHRRNVIHRDVKPANLMVSRDTGTVKILDFGIARGGDSALTQAGVLVGTPNYMSPEQVQGDAIDHRSDIFAVGAVLHELLVYRRAFSDEHAHVVLHKIVHKPHQPVIEIDRNLPLAVQPILDRAMAKRAADRYPDLELLRTDLIRLAERIAVDESDDTLAAPAGAMPSTEPERRSDASPGSGSGSGSGSSANRARLAERRAARIGAHMRAAEDALAAGRYDEALAEAELAEELDPDQTSVVMLLHRVRAAITTREVESALAEARQHLQTGSLSAAGAALSRASKLAPGSPDIQALRRQLDVAVEQREQARARTQKADAAMVQARECLRAGVLDGALRAIVEALGYEPERADAVALRGEIEEEIRRRVENVVALADREIASGHAGAAIDRLERFAPRHPQIVTALERARQEAARQAEEQRQQRIARDRAIDAVLAQARDLAAQDRIDAAIELLAQVTPADARLLDAIGKLRDELSQRERRRIAAEEQRARAAIARAQGLQQSGRATEAFNELDRFAPPHPLVVEALATLRAEHAARARDAVREAEALVARDRIADGIALLERVTPPTPVVTDALIRLRTARAAREARLQVDQAARRYQDEEQQRRTALDEWIARQLGDAKAALDASRFEDAIAAAQRTLDRVPDCIPAAQLLDAAVERQAARDAAAARDAKVQAHVQAARAQAEAGDFAAALAHLGSAGEIAPKDPGIASLRAVIEQQRAAAEDRARREGHDRRATELVAAARAQFAAGHHQQALRRCERFTPSHPLVTEAHRDLSAQLATIERDRAAEEQRAHDLRLAQLREQEEQARLAAAAAVNDSETTTVVIDALPGALADRARAGREAERDGTTRRETDAVADRTLAGRGPAHDVGAGGAPAVATPAPDATRGLMAMARKLAGRSRATTVGREAAADADEQARGKMAAGRSDTAAAVEHQPLARDGARDLAADARKVAGRAGTAGAGAHQSLARDGARGLAADAYGLAASASATAVDAQARGRARTIAGLTPMQGGVAAAVVAVLLSVGAWRILRTPDVVPGPGPGPAPAGAGEKARDETPHDATPGGGKGRAGAEKGGDAKGGEKAAEKRNDAIAGRGDDAGVEAHRLSTLLVDASPWARVVRVVDAKGRVVSGAGTYTPMTLAVAAGTYTVTLEREGKRRSEQVTVGEREQRTARVEFEPVDSDEFFRKQP